MKLPRDVLNVFYLLDQVRLENVDPKNARVMKMAGRPFFSSQGHLNSVGAEYIQGKDEMLAAERRILKELGFNVYVGTVFCFDDVVLIFSEQPHKYLLNYLNILDQDSKSSTFADLIPHHQS